MIREVDCGVMEWMQRFVGIMDAISAERQKGIGVTGLREKTGLSKGTLHRILQDMVTCKLVIQDPSSRKYSLGPRAMVWGSQFVAGADVSDLLSRSCEALAEETRLYAFLCRYVSHEVYCIYTCAGNRDNMTYFVHVGQRMPLHASSAAKAILAFQSPEDIRQSLAQITWYPYTERTQVDAAGFRQTLQEIRKQKVAWCHGEMEKGVSAISIPLIGQNGTVRFSLSLIGDSEEIAARQDELLPSLQATGHEMSQQLQAFESFGLL